MQERDRDNLMPTLSGQFVSIKSNYNKKRKSQAHNVCTLIYAQWKVT